MILTGTNLEALQAWEPRPAMAVTIVSGSGESLRARVISLEAERASLLVFEKMAASAESGVEITLLQALPDKERMELIIEKATELGADVIVPWKAERGVDLVERDSVQEKSKHWQRRATKAAKQCRRARLPAIMPFSSLRDALRRCSDCDLKLALYESGGEPGRDVIGSVSKPASVALLVGPEGGLAEGEMEAAQQAGFVPLHLGGRILRTETAAIVAVTIIQYVLGDLGGR